MTAAFSWGPLSSVAQAMAAPDQPHPTLSALDAALAATVGHKLFTVLILNFEKGENQRYYSNQPAAYPTGGAKPIVSDSAFFAQLQRGEPTFLRSYEEIKAQFPDHELIRSLRCESCVNMPIRWSGKTIGTLNLLHDEGWYREEQFPLIAAFAALAVAPALEIIRRW